jgi:hypothetical protein
MINIILKGIYVRKDGSTYRHNQSFNMGLSPGTCDTSCVGNKGWKTIGQKLM